MAAKKTAKKRPSVSNKRVSDLETRVTRIEEQLLGHLEGGPSVALKGGLAGREEGS